MAVKRKNDIVRCALSVIIQIKKRERNPSNQANYASGPDTIRHGKYFWLATISDLIQNMEKQMASVLMVSPHSLLLDCGCTWYTFGITDI